jgi:hypothetical protein
LGTPTDPRPRYPTATLRPPRSSHRTPVQGGTPYRHGLNRTLPDSCRRRQGSSLHDQGSPSWLFLGTDRGPLAQSPTPGLATSASLQSPPPLCFPAHSLFKPAALHLLFLGPRPATFLPLSSPPSPASSFYVLENCWLCSPPRVNSSYCDPLILLLSIPLTPNAT